MGERAQRGYDQTERDAFKRMPWHYRLRVNAMAIFLVTSVAAIVFLTFLYPLVSGFLGGDK